MQLQVLIIIFAFSSGGKSRMRKGTSSEFHQKSWQRLSSSPCSLCFTWDVYWRTTGGKNL